MTVQKDNNNFLNEVNTLIKKQGQNKNLNKAANTFFLETVGSKYSYLFSWMGRPIIQYPQDILMVQELIFKTNPEFIIETGVAHGGSLTLSASMLALLDLRENILPRDSKRKVIGIDLEIRKHNRIAIENHFLSNYIELIEGSSTDQNVINKINNLCPSSHSTMVFLDSDHTEEHVLRELFLYSKFVTKGSYLIVFDTSIEFFKDINYERKKWSVGNNPRTAISKFLENNNDFEIDKSIDDKLLISVAKEGYLKRM